MALPKRKGNAKSVHLMVDPDAEALQATTKQQAQAEQLEESAPGAIEKASAAYLDACEQAKQSLTVWNLEAVSRPIWQELVKQHPPKADDPDVWEVHLDTFAPAVIHEMVVDWRQGDTVNTLTLEDANTMWAEWDEATTGALYSACRELQEGRVSTVPFPTGTANLSDSELAEHLEQLQQSLQSLGDR